eukprot:COSAG01_NODE_6992_length_3401_cov_1.741672_4_plen_479_part_01
MAYIRFRQAEICLAQMAKLGSMYSVGAVCRCCTVDTPSRSLCACRQDWLRLDAKCRERIASGCVALAAWLSFLEEMEHSWLKRHKLSHSSKAGHMGGKGAQEGARQMPDKSTIALGSRLVLHVLFLGYIDAFTPVHHSSDELHHGARSPPHTFNASPEATGQDQKRTRSCSVFTRETAHTKCLCSICLASRLYECGKDWLDMSQHATLRANGTSWTAKRLIRTIASQEHHRGVMHFLASADDKPGETSQTYQVGAAAMAKIEICASKYLQAQAQLLFWADRDAAAAAAAAAGRHSARKDAVQSAERQLAQCMTAAGVSDDTWQHALAQARMHCELSDLYHSLADKVPDLLCVTTAGGWVGFRDPARRKQLATLLVIAGPVWFYYFDIVNDWIVISQLAEDGEWELAFVSIFVIFGAQLIGCFIDRQSTEGNRHTLEDIAEADTRSGKQQLPLYAPPLYVRVIMNLSFTRMLYETYWAFR